MNSGDKSNQEFMLSPISPDSNSIELDSEYLDFENVHDHSQYHFPQITADPYPRDLENIDIGGIDITEQDSSYDCSEISSAANSQNREGGNVHEVQAFDIRDVMPPALGPERRRRRGLDSLVLANFFTRTRNTPKKEYIRLRVIRGHKKANRQIIKNQKAVIKALHAFDSQKRNPSLIWNILENICWKHISTISQSCKTESGPATDGRARKTVSKNEARSCNNNFCRDYFSIPGILESYFWYIELIFANKNPTVLCTKFEIFCCDGQHSSECVNKWQVLHAYLNDIMIRDLEMTPWFPEGYYQRNITIEELEKNERDQQQANEGTLMQYTSS